MKEIVVITPFLYMADLVQRIAVDVRVHSHRLYAHRTARLDHSAGDFS